LQGFGEKMPFPDASFDFSSMGYTLRHVEDLHALFSEFRRVLKRGGKVLVLAISRPKSPFAFSFLKVYMGQIVPKLTKPTTGDQDAARLMEYYWATVAECVHPERVVEALKQSGFDGGQRLPMGGVLNDYVGVNPE
jgi:demethylmenaquinone methyltransferase/2-methoxy-6-polyprenyl-1,4-benzoquinol methylase